MIIKSKVIGLLSGCFLLCLGLINVANANDTPSAADNMYASQSGREGGQAGLKGEEDKLIGGSISEPGRKGGQAGLRGEDDKLRALTSTRTIKGEVLGVEGDRYYLQTQDGTTDGTTVRVSIDQSTKKSETIHEGTPIEAEVDAQGHALSIRSAASTDRRNLADRKG